VVHASAFLSVEGGAVLDAANHFRAGLIVVVETLDHLHPLAAIQPRIADVRKLVAQLVRHLVIRQEAMLGHVVVEFDVLVPLSPRRLRFPYTARRWALEGLADRKNVRERFGHVQRKFGPDGLLEGLERSLTGSTDTLRLSLGFPQKAPAAGEVSILAPKKMIECLAEESTPSIRCSLTFRKV
jgi:hypothetical protein